MKTLELKQMEKLQGGGFWSNCGAGAAAGLGTLVSVGGHLFGPWAVFGSLVVGCVVGVLS